MVSLYSSIGRQLLHQKQRTVRQQGPSLSFTKFLDNISFGLPWCLWINEMLTALIYFHDLYIVKAPRLSQDGQHLVIMVPNGAWTLVRTQFWLQRGDCGLYQRLEEEQCRHGVTFHLVLRPKT